MTCCIDGWRITLAGSRFLSKAEVNYWPTEGEMLGVAWALHDTRFFTLGCRDLHVQTDHRALVKLLGDKRLEDIDNRRLVNLKEKTMPWNFTVSWVPGKEIPAPDATSRQPQGTTEDDGFEEAAVRLDPEEDIDMANDEEFAAYGRLKAGEITAVTWERVQEETWLDESMRSLMSAIRDGLNDMALEETKDGVAEYWRHRHSLTILDGVVMMGERIVIPPSLRKEVLAHLHGAHQGVSQMTARAQASVFWPGITSDIARTRNNCGTCDTIAPSQPSLEAAPPTIPAYRWSRLGRIDRNNEGDLHGVRSPGGGGKRRRAGVYQPRVREVPGEMGGQAPHEQRLSCSVERPGRGRRQDRQAGPEGQRRRGR